ncbi:echinoderm microtubule-associated protein-like 2 [Ptychodera flava]|uniref:echinoderm microtubule-associated protein-like 2 n=2 Tax=Ptychodera flava TaxID=63121 RepID=UPI00396A87AB
MPNHIYPLNGRKQSKCVCFLFSGSAGKIPKNSSNASLASYESHHSKGKTVSVGSAAETVSTNSTNLTVESNVTSNSTNSTNSDNSHTHASSQESTSDIKDTASVLKTMSSTSLASMATSQGETINSTNELQDLNSSQDTASELMKPLLPPEPQEKTVPPTPPPPPPEIKVTRKDSTSSFKNSASNVKNSGGFLSSVKSLFKGNKNKENNQEMIPIVTVNSPEPSSESDPVLPPPGGAVHEVTIRGRSMKYFMPDMYYHKTINSYPPKEKLELDWIYGYRGNDCRCNIYMLASGEAIYFTATFVIIFNIEQKLQRYYKEHTTEIRSIALHPNRVTVATGQIAKGKEQAHIRIWQADTLQTLQVLGIGLISKSVMCLAFAQAQDRLVSIDNGDVKTMVIWDINKGKEIAKTSVNTEVICQVGFHPKNANNLVTVGKEHQIWWTANPSEGTIEEMMRANFEEKWMKAKYVICMMFKANGDLITGDSNGTIYVWHDGGNTVSQAIKHAHEGPVFSLIMIRNHLVSAGRDGLLLSWTWGRNFDQSGSMQLPKSEGGIRMLCHSKDMILIGTTLNSILTCNMATTGAPLMGISSLHKTPMTQSHYDEARALTTYPSNTQQGLFVTGGYDGIIAMFDAHQHKTVWKHSIKGLNIHCLDIHPNGKLLALGVRDASVSVVYINGSTEISELCKAKVAKDRINCIKFSPDGECLAVGCYDKNIYILQLLEGGKKCESIGKCKGHNSLVTGLDWSVDKPFGNYILQSSSLGFEHFYWDGASCEKLENPSELRNIEWVSHNCMMGYPVSGIMGSSSDNSTVYAVDRSYNHRLVATVNERKQIHLYNYPCSSPEAQSRVYEANHVDTVNISFVYGNSYLITLGGKDTCIMQWKIVSS